MNTELIVALWVFIFFIERLVEGFNLHAASKPLPASLSDLQTPEEQSKAYHYLRDRTQLAWIRETLQLGLFFWLIFAGIYGKLAKIAFFHFHPTPSLWSSFLPTFFFIVLFSLPSSLLGLPFDWRSTFKIEARYGFNRTTVKTFILDRMKGLMIGALLGALLLALYFFALLIAGQNAWIVAWLLFIGFQFLMTWLAPKWIIPLFLKLSPLEEGELKTELEQYAKKEKFSLEGVFTCDASKRSTKTNAFFAGIGSGRRLVLFDTLLEKHPTSEVMAVVAHEAGHFKLGHIWKNVLITGISSFVFLYLLQYLTQTPEIFEAFHISPDLSFGIGFPLALTFLSRLGFFFQAFSAAISRKFEYEADAFSLRTYPVRNAMICALKRLGSENLSIILPHPFHTWLYASHPPLPERIRAIEALSERG